MTLFVLGTMAILAFLAWATFQSALLLRHHPIPGNLLLIPSENLLRLALLSACVALGFISGLPLTTLGWTLFDPIRDISWGLAIGAMIAASLPPLTRWAIESFGKHVYSPVIIRSILPRNRHEWLLVPLALVSAVLLEEVLFRSLLLGGFGEWVSPLLLALVWSVMFGMMHLPQGTLGVVAAMVLSLVLSILFVVTTSLLTPLVAHYVINLLQIARACFDPSYKEILEENA